MTVEAPDFDKDLLGHSAVVLDESSVCHAVGSKYGTEGYLGQYTECGIEVQDEETHARTQFASNYEMCPECWPESVVANSQQTQ